MPMRRVKRRLLCAEPRRVVCKPAILLQRPGPTLLDEGFRARTQSGLVGNPDRKRRLRPGHDHGILLGRRRPEAII